MILLVACQLERFSGRGNGGDTEANFFVVVETKFVKGNVCGERRDHKDHAEEYYEMRKLDHRNDWF